jgi:hypothetical protein
VKTVSSASGTQSYAYVLRVAAQPTRSIDPRLPAPEETVDFSARRQLLAARDVEESSLPSISTGSPFGI